MVFWILNQVQDDNFISPLFFVNNFKVLRVYFKVEIWW
jgi:hypothetical protein